MKVRIKNMVCDRCIKMVKEIFVDNGLETVIVSLGEVILADNIIKFDLEKTNEKLIEAGFEIVVDQDEQLVHKIKSLIIELIHHQNQPLDKISDYLTSNLNRSYSSLSKTFSQRESKTIEQFTIEHKIEKSKELISYGELSISEISYLLNYSSPQHFSRQFKKTTGITPTQFLQSGNRQKLDKI